MRNRVSLLALTLVLASSIASSVASAQTNDLPGPLKKVGVDPQLGETLPLEAVFVDDQGAEVRLGDLLQGRPLILAPIYYDCPMLCTMVLRGITRTLKVLEFEPGSDFDLVAYSINPEDTPEAAARVKQQHLREYGKPETADGWRFLSGDAEAVTALSNTIGYRYQYLEDSGEFAHGAAIMVITPEGKIGSYHLGIDYPARDLRLALVDAADGGIGSWVDQALLFCYRYDPTVGKYTFAAWNTIRAGGLITLALVVWFVVVSARRERKPVLAEAK